MADSCSGNSPNDHSAAQQPGQSTDLERVQELTWALLDEQIADEDKAWLESALSSSAEARGMYVRCVQIHTDLMAHFSKNAVTTAKPESTSQVLGFLQGSILPLELQPPVSDQAAS
jgi:hypothetical protein